MILQADHLLTRLKRDFPGISFEEAEDFSWSSGKNVIYFTSDADGWQQLVLHEVAHSVLGHESYRSDAELLKFEAQAWDYAKKQLAAEYGVSFDDDFIEDHKDSYREWLHKRSQCPRCEYGGWQTGLDQYKCPICLSTWRVNSSKLKHVYRQLKKK